jgi:hypothetical protein
VVNFLEIGGNAFLIYLILFNAFYKRTIQIAIENHLTKIEKSLKEFHLNPCYRQIEINIIVYSISVLTYYFVFLNLIYYFVFNGLENRIEYWMFYYMMQSCLNCFFCKYIANLFIFIKISANSLNALLKSEAQAVQSKLIKGKGTELEKVKQFLQLFRLYDEITALLPMISDGYGISMLGSMCFYLVISISQMFTVRTTYSKLRTI